MSACFLIALVIPWQVSSGRQGREMRIGGKIPSLGFRACTAHWLRAWDQHQENPYLLKSVFTEISTEKQQFCLSKKFVKPVEAARVFKRKEIETIIRVPWLLLMVWSVLLAVLSTLGFRLPTIASPGKLLMSLSFLVVRLPDFEFLRRYEGVLNP